MKGRRKHLEFISPYICEVKNRGMISLRSVRYGSYNDSLNRSVD